MKATVKTMHDYISIKLIADTNVNATLTMTRRGFKFTSTPSEKHFAAKWVNVLLNMLDDIRHRKDIKFDNGQIMENVAKIVNAEKSFTDALIKIDAFKWD